MATLEQMAVNFLTRNRNRSLTVVASSRIFKALLSVAPPFDPNTELGQDQREKAVMECAATGSSDIKLNSYLTDGSTRWVVVGRDNNPADSTDTAKFVLAKVADEDQ